MKQHPEVTKNGLVRRSGEVTPFNAGDAVGAACVAYGAPIPRKVRARLGRAAKELLEDGFEPRIVCEALYAALKRERFDLVDNFAMQVQNAHMGLGWSWSDWQRVLHTIDRSANPEMQAIQDGLRGAFK